MQYAAFWLVIAPWIGPGQYGTPTALPMPSSEACHQAAEVFEYSTGRGFSVTCTVGRVDKEVEGRMHPERSE